jgi:hypothetical protein
VSDLLRAVAQGKGLAVRHARSLCCCLRVQQHYSILRIGQQLLFRGVEQLPPIAFRLWKSSLPTPPAKSPAGATNRQPGIERGSQVKGKAKRKGPQTGEFYIEKIVASKVCGMAAG